MFVSEMLRGKINKTNICDALYLMDQTVLSK